MTSISSPRFSRRISTAIGTWTSWAPPQFEDSVTWWENSAGDGTVWIRHDIDDDFNGARSVDAADVDGDGDLDVFGTATIDDVIVWWENAAGDATIWIEHPIGEDLGLPGAVYAADVDGDGDMDVFIGAGFSISGDRGLTGERVRQHLIAGLEAKCQGKPDGFATLPLPTVAGVYESMYSRDELRATLQSFLQTKAITQPLDHHHLLAALPQFRILVTTNWDNLIEQAFGLDAAANDDAEDGHKSGLSIASTSKEVVSLDFERTILLKIYGDATATLFEPRITDKDLHDFQYQEPLLFNMLKHLVASYRVIVTGFRPDDTNLRSILYTTSLVLGDQAKPVCVVDPSEDVRFLLPNTQHVPLTASVFLQQVQRFNDFQGGNVGLAFRDTDRPIGLVRCWAKDECKLAGDIQARYRHLRRVEVIQARPGNLAAKRTVGGRAATLIREIVHPGDRVAFSCGSSLAALVEHAREDWTSFKGVTLCSTSVPLTDHTHVVAPVALVTLLAQRLSKLGVHGRSYQLPSGFVKSLSNPEFVEFLNEDPAPQSPEIEAVVKTYLGEAATSRVFVLGVGAISAGKSGFYQYGLSCILACRTDVEAGPEELMDFYRVRLHDLLKYEGDLIYRPFHNLKKKPKDVLDEFMNETRLLKCLRSDIEPVIFKGANVTKHYKEFLARIYCHVRSIDLQVLLDATLDDDRTVVLVATGAQKAAAVRSLCAAQIGDTLVIDHDLAESMMTQ